MDGFYLVVDLAIGELLPRLVRSGKVADSLGRKIHVEAGDENGRTQDFREAGGMVLERIARWRLIRSVELERRRAGDEGLFAAAGRCRGSFGSATSTWVLASQRAQNQRKNGHEAEAF